MAAAVVDRSMVAAAMHKEVTTLAKTDRTMTAIKNMEENLEAMSVVQAATVTIGTMNTNGLHERNIRATVLLGIENPLDTSHQDMDPLDTSHPDMNLQDMMIDATAETLETEIGTGIMTMTLVAQEAVVRAAVPSMHLKAVEANITTVPIKLATNLTLSHFSFKLLINRIKFSPIYCFC